MNKSLPSLHSATQSPSSVRAYLGHSPVFLGGMTTFASCDTPDVAKDNHLHPLSFESVHSCAVSPAFNHYHCETSYKDLHEKAEFEKRRAEKSELELNNIENELEDLTLSLFTEANRLVEKERRIRVEMEIKLKQAYLELDRRKSQETDPPQEQRPQYLISPSSKESNPLLGSTLQLAEFELFFKQLQDQPFHKLHELPYMKVCLRLDIIPCLKMTQEDTWIKKWLHTLIHHPCYIEDRKTGQLHDIQLKRKMKKDPVNYATWKAELPEFEIVCVGCQKPMALSPSRSIYRFRWSPQDPWQWMGQQCRNRSVAVCNFYSFLRHIKQRLTINRSLPSLYEEMVHLRLTMHAARKK